MSHDDTFSQPVRMAAAPGRQDTPRGNSALARLPQWLPALVVGLLVSGLTLLVWSILLRYQQHTTAEATQAAAEHVAHEVTARLEARIQALQRMAARWERHGQSTHADWEADATLYLHHYPGYQALGWIDSAFTLQWVAPLAGNEAAVGLHAAAEPRRRAALEAARDQRTVHVTHVLDLAQGGKGVAVYVPLFPHGTFAGVLSGVFRLQALGDTLLRDIAPGYGVVLLDGTDELYRRLPADAASAGARVHETTIPVPGATWRVQVWPGPDVTAQHHSGLPHALLGLGLALAGALSLTVFLAQTARQRSHDVTLLNQQLTQEQAYLRTLLQHLPAGALIADAPAGTIRFANAAFHQMWGYAQLPGHSLTDLSAYRGFHADGRPYQTADWPVTRAAQTGETVQDEEIAFQRSDGERRFMTANAAPVRDAEGHIIAAVVVASDITERKRLENSLRTLNAELEQRVQERTAALQESEARFRLLADSAPVLIWVDGLEGSEFVNQEYLRFTGVNAEAVRGYAWASLVHPEDRDALVASYRTTLAQRSRFTAQFRFRRHDGVYRWMHLIALPRVSPQGEYLGYVGAVTDITDLKEAEQTLTQHASTLERLNIDLHTEITARQHVEERLRERVEEVETLFDLLPVAVWQAHDPNCSHITGNRAGYEMLRLPLGANASLSAAPPERPIGHQMYHPNGTVVRPEDLPMQYAAAHGVAVPNTEVVYRFTDGAEVYAYGTAKPLFDVQGNIRGSLGVFIDITARKQTEAALQDAHQRLTFHIENSPLAVIEWDAGFCVQRWSTQAEQWFGWTAAEVDGKLPTEWGFVHPEDAPAVAEIMTRLLTSHEPRNVSHNRNLTKDGRVLHCEWYNSILKDATGRTVSILSLVHDVTARTEAERALQESQRFLTHITDTTPALLYVYDLQQQRNVYINPQIETLLGYSRADIQQFGAALFSTLVHPDDLERVNARVQVLATLRDDHVPAMEYRMRHRNGEWRWLHSQEVIFRRTVDGTPWQILGAALDITARKQAEAALAQQLQLTQAITDNATTALFIMDDRQHCVFMNPAAEQLTGYALDEVRGRALHDVVHHTHPDGTPYPLADCPIDRAFPEHNQMQGEEVFVHKNGHFYPVAFSASPLREGRAVRGTIIEVQDISARKHAEEALAQHARDLASAHADLRQVAYVSAHDLQEPIRQIGIYTQHIAKQYGATMDADMQDAIAFIVEGTKRMQAQFTDLMHYLEMEDPGIGITTTDCETVLQHALEKLHEPMTTSGATITHDPLPTLEANAKHLQLVFQELIENAVKFRNSAPPHVHVWAEREERGWRFAVRDNGIGISQSGMSQLFGFFRKLQQRQAYPGTGMGLAICKKIVERHGGRIWIDSTLGEGTTMYFTVSNAGGGGGKKR